MARRFVNLPKYDILKRIGRGAGAVIYEARDRASREVVAIKHVVRKGPEHDRFIVQAETEYDVGHQLDHPNLRRFHEMVRVRRWLKTRELFLLMEYVDGDTLESRFKNQTPPTKLTGPIELFMQVADGLHALHQHGFVHADIKPNNILLTPRGVKIIDFGQSCPIGHKKERVQGTPDFIAPEQVNRSTLDQRTDAFNLGATMYWVVTGKWFRTMMNRGGTAAKKIEIDARSGSEPPEELNPAVGVPLSRLIMDCCEPRPDDRPADMKTIISRLELILHLVSKRTSGPERADEEADSEVVADE